MADLTFKSTKTKDGRDIVVELHKGAERIGCVWETTVVDGLFNWCLHDGTRQQGYGYARDGYSLESAKAELMKAAHQPNDFSVWVSAA